MENTKKAIIKTTINVGNALDWMIRMGHFEKAVVFSHLLAIRGRLAINARFYETELVMDAGNGVGEVSFELGADAMSVLGWFRDAEEAFMPHAISTGFFDGRKASADKEAKEEFLQKWRALQTNTMSGLLEESRGVALSLHHNGSVNPQAPEVTGSASLPLEDQLVEKLYATAKAVVYGYNKALAEIWIEQSKGHNNDFVVYDRKIHCHTLDGVALSNQFLPGSFYTQHPDGGMWVSLFEKNGRRFVNIMNIPKEQLPENCDIHFVNRVIRKLSVLFGIEETTEKNPNS